MLTQKKTTQAVDKFSKSLYAGLYILPLHLLVWRDMNKFHTLRFKATQVNKSYNAWWHFFEERKPWKRGTKYRLSHILQVQTPSSLGHVFKKSCHVRSEPGESSR